MTPTPPSGTPALIAGQLHRDDGQDADLRRQRRALVALIVWSVALPIGALAAWRVSPRPVAVAPSPSPVVHVAPPPACPPCPACAACPACPQPVARRR